MLAVRVQGRRAGRIGENCYSAGMDAERKPKSRVLGEGVGWRASDVVCSAGPTDVPFEETS